MIDGAAWPLWDALAGLRGVTAMRREDIRRYQSARLRSLVRHAASHVPYHRRHFLNAGLQARDVRGMDDLHRIPLTNRADLTECAPLAPLDERCDPARLCFHQTSGSTGRPMTVRTTPAEERLLQAYRLRVMFHYGLQWRDRRASVRWIDSRVDPWWVKLGLLRYEGISVTDEAGPIKENLLRLAPSVMEGYPGRLSEVAEIMTDADRMILRPKFIAVGGETLSPLMRREIERGFRAPVRNVYGSHEFNLIAWECPTTGLLHLLETSIVAEVLRDGKPAGVGEAGELVGTALHSYAMPFLRYRLGDWVVKGPDPCPCGAPFATLERVEGRVVEMFQLPDGRRFHPFGLEDALIESAPWVRKVQLIQERRDLIRLLVVAPLDMPESAEKLAFCRRTLEPWGAGQAHITVEQVPDIPPEKNGKHRLYKCLVP